MFCSQVQFRGAPNLDCLLLLLITALFLAFTPPTSAKAIPNPVPVPDPPHHDNSPPPEPIIINPKAPAGALGMPPNPVQDIDTDWFSSQLIKPQPDNNCVFYCHISDQAKLWVEQNQPLRTIWETYPKEIFLDADEPRKYFLQADVDAKKGDNKYRNRYAAMSSQAYAHECRGTVHLLLDEKRGKLPGCIWDTEEEKEIRRESGPANKIITIILHAGTSVEKSRSEDNFRAAPQPAQPCPPPGSNAKRAPSCDAHPVSSPICTYREDPDQRQKGGKCICSDSVTLPKAASTGSNIGAHYNPCPMTSLPPVTKPPAPKPTNTPEFAFTTTELNSDVVACQSAAKSQVAGFPITECGGSSVTLSIAPSLSVQPGKQKQNVGELTGTALFTSVSKALDKLCPVPTASIAPTNCTAGSTEIDQVAFFELGGTRINQGSLQVEVKDSFYNTEALRQALIRSAALTAQHSAKGKNCYTVRPQWPDFHGGTEPVTLCNAVDFAGVQHYDGKGLTTFLDAEWTFETPGGGPALTCDTLQEELAPVLAELAALPEFAFLGVGIEEIFVAVCQALNGKGGGGGGVK